MTDFFSTFKTAEEFNNYCRTEDGETSLLKLAESTTNLIDGDLVHEVAELIETYAEQHPEKNVVGLSLSVINAVAQLLGYSAGNDLELATA